MLTRRRGVWASSARQINLKVSNYIPDQINFPGVAHNGVESIDVKGHEVLNRYDSQNAETE